MADVAYNLSEIWRLCQAFSGLSAGAVTSTDRWMKEFAPLDHGNNLLLTTGRFSMLYEDRFALELTKKEDLDVIEVNAPMAGKVIDVKVKVGDTVSENDEVVILEAMKMELPIVATGSGKVKEIRCKKGDPVEADAVLIVLG